MCICRLSLFTIVLPLTCLPIDDVYTDFCRASSMLKRLSIHCQVTNAISHTAYCCTLISRIYRFAQVFLVISTFPSFLFDQSRLQNCTSRFPDAHTIDLENSRKTRFYKYIQKLKIALIYILFPVKINSYSRSFFCSQPVHLNHFTYIRIFHVVLIGLFTRIVSIFK